MFKRIKLISIAVMITLLMAACALEEAPLEIVSEAESTTTDAGDSPTAEQPTAEPSVEAEPEAEATLPAEGEGSPTEPPAAATLEMFCSVGDDFEVCGGGPTAVTGEITSGAVDYSPDYYPEPTVALIDMSNRLQGRPELFVEEQGQILGFLTEPLFPQPGRFHINLPIVPTAASTDVDNDGEEDAGVQIFALSAASNLINSSYLQQLEQLPKVVSYITDVSTGEIQQGTFLVYSPDDEQGFPSGWGADEQWFTADDPSVPLPAGYTLATLEPDGTVTLDRSPELTMNTVERAGAASPDFSDQGILESYESLIATLKERYAYTDLRQLDWDAIRAEYLPRVEEADANEDVAAYFLVLNELAKSLNDTHVAAASLLNVEAIVAQANEFNEQVGSGIGVSTIAVSDEETPEQGPGDTILVLTVGEGSPAAEAGLVPGTEIVTINGEPPASRYDDIPLVSGLGTEEGRRVAKSRYLLSFPADESVTVEYRLPGESEVRSATFVTGQYDSGGPGPVFNAAPVTFEERGSYAVISWSDFVHDVQAKIAVLQEALGFEQGNPSAGIIIDMRGNGGGWVPLYETMASHFFTAEEPMPVHLFDYWTYDEAAGEHVRQFQPDYTVSAPRPDLAYTGPLVVLVDESCISSCEYFTQHLQRLDRATVIGQYATAGAGGFIERAQMPGGLIFQFTQGKTTFTGTDEPNLEAKGVVPDIRVPVTLETELAKLRGEDPVMDAAIAELDRQTGAGAAPPGEVGDGAISTLNEELTNQLNAFLASQVYTEGGNPQGAAPGLVLLVDTPDGRYLNAAGVSSLETGEPMRTDDRLEIGSNSKSFTIAVLMQLQEEGLLSFDDMLSDWLPELAAQIPNGEEITLRQLASHTSGIWDYGDPLIGAAAENPDQLEIGYAPEELVQYAVDNGAPDFDPGTNFKYSNTGYILLGMIAEKASGQSLGELYQERIFDPLGLESAVFIEGVPEEGDITTQGYWWLDDGTRLNTTNWNVSQGWAAGGIAMNAADLVTYGKALAAGELFQDPASLAQMLAFNEKAMATGGAPFGLGLIDFGDGYWGHEGQTAGFQSLWYTNPDEGITVAGLTNSAAFSGFSFLNVRNILDGRGAQPFQAATLLPVADQMPLLTTSNWEWTRATEGSTVTDIPPGFVLALAKDGTAILASPSCGPLNGTFTADAAAQISFAFDLSAVTCAAEDPTLQLADALQSGGSWHFDNGSLSITLAEDGSELIFLPAPPEAAPVVSEACPLFDLPYPRPEPAYNGKMVRDFSPFYEALADYSAEDAAAMEQMISGKTIPELQALMESGELTAYDLAVYYLERIQRYDVDKLNSVLELNPEVLAIAQALDAERTAGTVRGDMHGIPVLLKDNIATGDQLHTAAGAAALLEWDPSRDAFLVSRLREAGAVILGKANLSEWANYMDSCMPNGFSTNGGQTQNPYGPFETFGSSSGSAVSVAADLTTVSVGTETQGSIIEPAIINSVVALKPTKGLISTDYVIPLLPFQDVPGPMGRTVTDVAVLLSALTGVDENDFTTAATAELAGVDFTQYLNPESLEGVRVGVPVWNEEAFQAYFEQFDITDEEQQASLRDAAGALNADVQPVIDALTAAGVTVVEIPNTAVPPNPGNVSTLLEYGFQQAINDFLAGLGDEAPVSSLEDIIAFNNEDLANRAPYGQDYLEGSANTAITLAEFASQQQLDNGAARNGIDIFFENFDIDVVVSKLSQAYAPAGYPALTVPAGYAEDGTPVGTVFTGLRLSEPQLLAVGYAYEQASQARVAPDLEATMELIAETAVNVAGDELEAEPAGQDAEGETKLAGILGNLSYDGLFPDESVTLLDGYAAYDDGSSGTPYVQLMTPLITSGDLDGDGTEDAVSLLQDHSSGSGTFVYLVAVLDALNNPTPVEALMIGDRIQVKSLVVDGSEIVANLVAQGPNDPLCCPSWNVRKVFALEEGAIVERSSEELSRIALEDLNDTTWRLLDLNGGQEPALPDIDVTLHVKDGLLNGSAGCNTYRSTIESGPEGLNSLVIGPAATTKKACLDPVMEQETNYLARLDSAAAWWFDAGRLALTYPADEEGNLAYLLFERSAE